MEALTKNAIGVRNILKFTYGLIPIVAGADKFTNILTDWAHYLNPAIAAILPVTPHSFMMFAGVIEIIAGIIVLINPRLGGYLVSVWLFFIAVNLITGGNYLDVAVRDIAMSIGAFCLAKLSAGNGSRV